MLLETKGWTYAETVPPTTGLVCSLCVFVVQCTSRVLFNVLGIPVMVTPEQCRPPSADEISMIQETSNVEMRELFDKSHEWGAQGYQK